MKRKLAWILSAVLTVSVLPPAGVMAAEQEPEAVVETVENGQDKQEEEQQEPAAGTTVVNNGTEEEQEAQNGAEETAGESGETAGALRSAPALLSAGQSGSWIVITDEKTEKEYYQYQYTDGTFAEEWTEIEELKYYFDPETDYAKTGWFKDQGYWYYLNPDEKGAMTVGFITIGSNTYYLDEDGHMQTNKWLTVDGEKYYVDGWGYVKKGFNQISGKWYYFDPEDGALATGLTEIDGKTYVLDPNTGAMVVNNTVEIDGETYAADGWGVIRSGWVQTGGKWYYYDPANGNALAKGITQIGGKAYLLDPETGAMAVNKSIEIDGKTYTADGWGNVRSGWVQTGGKWYYYDPEDDYALAKGITEIGEYTYVLDPNTGAMIVNGNVDIDGKTYGANGWGYLQSGWAQIQGKWYYYDPANDNAMAKGITQIGDYTYVLDPNTGTMIVNGTVDIDGKTYGANGWGYLQSGWAQIQNKWYYFDPANDNAMAKGITQIGEYTYLLDPKTGIMAVNSWVQIGKDWYHGNEWGYLQTGWTGVNGYWYYLDPENNGAMVKNQFVPNFDGLHFVDGYGIMQVATSVSYQGKLYFMDKWGVKVEKAGWIQSGTDWYYAKDDTGELATGWQGINGRSYYLDLRTGRMYKGPNWIGGTAADRKLWFFDPTNGWLVTGKNQWIKNPNTPYWYYVYSDGHCAVNTTIDGYPIDGNGIWVEDPLWQEAQKYTSLTKYLIVADRKRHWLAVFEGQKTMERNGRTRWYDWKKIKGNWRITTGALSTPTPLGEHNVVFRSDNPWGYYTFTETKAAWCTYFSGGFFIHSILYNYKNDYSTNPKYESIADGDLGVNRSHSCIRLTRENAEWVYDNIGWRDDTKLVVFESTTDY